MIANSLAPCSVPLKMIVLGESASTWMRQSLHLAAGKQLKGQGDRGVIRWKPKTRLEDRKGPDQSVGELTKVIKLN